MTDRLTKRKPVPWWFARLLIFLWVVCSPLQAHAAKSTNILVWADGTAPQIEGLELALIQQFAGESVAPLVNPENDGVDQALFEVTARVVFHRNEALLELTRPGQSPTRQTLRIEKTAELCRTLAILISEVATHAVPAARHAPAVAALPLLEDPAPTQDQSSAESSAPSASLVFPTEVSPIPVEDLPNIERGNYGPSPQPRLLTREEVEQRLQKELSVSEPSAESDLYYSSPQLDAQKKRHRPLRPWLTATGLAVTAALSGAAVGSSLVPVPPPDVTGPDHIITTDELREWDSARTRKRTRTIALAASSAIAGTLTIVLATTFTDWGGRKKTLGLSLTSLPGGAGGTLVSDF